MFKWCTVFLGGWTDGIRDKNTYPKKEVHSRKLTNKLILLNFFHSFFKKD